MGGDPLEVRERDSAASFVGTRLGPHVLVFDLRTLLAAEAIGVQVEHAEIRGPIDLAEWLGVPAEGERASLLVPTASAVYRIMAGPVSRLLRRDLRAVFPVPELGRSLFERLCVRGLVVLAGGELGFLIDPQRLVAAAEPSQVAP